MNKGPYIAVVGPGEATAGELVAAEAVGRGLAARGAVIVCGGLGGVMAGACRGAKAVGGTTVGILPGNERAAANEWVDVVVSTGLGEARNVLVVRAADAVVAIGGGYGTLSEIALALKAGKPVIGVDTWTLGRDPDPIARAGDPDEAATMALAALR
jgi:uncharacterized protein (TIGR00725 family)